jgi:hypothetical protein
MKTEVNAGQARDGVAASAPVRWLAWFGGACYGLVHLVLAWLAVRVGFLDPPTATDRRGAVVVIAARPLGAVLLWIMTAGLIAFGAWQLVHAATGFQWITGTRERLVRRLGTAGRALVALAVASVVLRLLTGVGQPGVTARLLTRTAGRALVLVVGVGFVAAACLSAWSGLRRRFVRELDTTAMPARRLVETCGSVGFLAKAVALGVIGVLLGVAAVRLDPYRSGGLDRALRTLGGHPYGMVALFVMAAGFVVFGLYYFADARYRRSG